MNEQNKRAALIVAMIISIAPIGFIVPFPAMHTLKAIALYGSALFGYAGVVMLLWMYMLGTRAATNFVFRDTAAVLSIHKWVGKYGAIGILLHPLLVVYSYGESLLYTFVPQLGTQFERHVTLGRLSFLLLIVIWLTSVTFRKKLAYRPWKYIHYLAYVSLPFALLHIPNVGSAYMSQVSAKVYYFTLVIGALFFTVIRLRSLFGLDRYQYTVTMHKQISDDTFMMTLAPQNPSHMVAPDRGQYVYIRLGVVSEDHPFSVVQYEEDTGKLTVAYRVFGTFTESLSRYNDGSTVLLDGPYGSFTSEIETETKPVVFIAGGIGVTPFVDHILRGNLEEQWLFYASKDESRAAFLPVLQDELGAHCIPIFSSANNGNRIDSTIIKNHLNDPSRYNYFMCGPVGLMDTSQEALESLGVPRAQIYREAFAF